MSKKKQAYEIIFESGLVIPTVVMNENIKYDNNFIGFNRNQKYHLTIVENICQVTVIERSEEQIKQTKLPEGYTVLSCIISNGTVYTRVPIQLTNNSRVVTKYRYCGGPTVPDLFGSTDAIRECKRGFVFGQEVGRANELRLNYGNTTTTLEIGTSYNNKIRISDFDKNKLYIDNVLVYEFPEAVFSIPTSYYCLFRYFNGSQDYQIGASQGSAIYSQQVYEDDVLVADLIPALRFDGIASFYDTVSGTFLEVRGARTFEYSSESIEEDSEEDSQQNNYNQLLQRVNTIEAENQTQNTSISNLQSTTDSLQTVVNNQNTILEEQTTAVATLQDKTSGHTTAISNLQSITESNTTQIEQQAIIIENHTTQIANIQTDYQSIEGDTVEIVLNHNTSYSCGTVDELSIEVNSTDPLYISEITFTSGESATMMMYGTIIFSGTDTEDGDFIPANNTRYDIVFWIDNGITQAVVRGVSSELFTM